MSLFKKTTNKTANKCYLNISYDDKEKAKFLGAKWDADEVQWYAINTTKEDFMCQFKRVNKKDGKFYMMNDDEFKIKQIEDEIVNIERCIRHHDNADITIPDYALQQKLEKELEILYAELEQLQAQ